MPTITLPYPPSINHYWRQFRGRSILSRDGRAYRDLAVGVATDWRRLNGVTGAIPGRLAVHIAAYPPDGRRRDVDNIPKAVLDALKHAEVYEDDSQIDDLRIVRMAVEKPGRVEVTIQAAHLDAAGRGEGGIKCP
jgi:crossover junction endodeoxyribonuclease RusA